MNTNTKLFLPREPLIKSKLHVVTYVFSLLKSASAAPSGEGNTPIDKKLKNLTLNGSTACEFAGSYTEAPGATGNKSFQGKLSLNSWLGTSLYFSHYC